MVLRIKIAQEPPIVLEPAPKAKLEYFESRNMFLKKILLEGANFVIRFLIPEGVRIFEAIFYEIGQNVDVSHV